MRVAIIGAGISGLSCAYEFEKHGVSPVIVEKNSYIGDRYSLATCFLGITSRPIKDCIEYVNQKFDLELKPINTINQLIHHSPNKMARIKGDLGYFILRGQEENSLKRQIYSRLRSTRIHLGESGDFKALSKEYDYVIVADAKPDVANELGCWIHWFKGTARGINVSGNFDPNTLTMWINKKYSKNGYSYLAPINEKKASIVSILSDGSDREADTFWNTFIQSENLNYPIIEEFKATKTSGLVYPHKVENVYFVGNAGGAIDPFLGFGQLHSIEMGVMAVRSIMENMDYDKLILDITNKNNQFFEFRKAYNRLTDKNYDRIINMISLPGVKQFLYNSPLDVVRYGSYVLKVLNKFKSTNDSNVY